MSMDNPKSITVDEDTRERLKSLKYGNMTYDDLVDALLDIAENHGKFTNETRERLDRMCPDDMDVDEYINHLLDTHAEESIFSY